MQANLFAALTHHGPGLLTRALRDPRVKSLAGSLGLDLLDPVTLNKLMALSQRHLDAASGLDPDQKKAISRALTPIQSPYARRAVQAYLDMASMG
jgi:hypothetical protein